MSRKAAALHMATFKALVTIEEILGLLALRTGAEPRDPWFCEPLKELDGITKQMMKELANVTDESAQ